MCSFCPIPRIAKKQNHSFMLYVRSPVHCVECSPPRQHREFRPLRPPSKFPAFLIAIGDRMQSSATRPKPVNRHRQISPMPRVRRVYLTSATSLFLTFFTFDGICNLRVSMSLLVRSPPAPYQHLF